MNISSTTWALMRYAKSEGRDFKWKSIRDNCLGELYHYDMRLDDVFSIVLKSLDEVVNEPRFDTPYGKDLLWYCLRQPLRVSLFWDASIITVEDTYNSILSAMLSHGYTLARVDWCKKELDKK